MENGLRILSIKLTSTFYEQMAALYDQTFPVQQYLIRTYSKLIEQKGEYTMGGEDRAFYEKVAMTKEELTNYLAPARLARISTVENDKPHLAPVWYLYDGKNFFISTGTKTRKARNIESNPNVSLIIDSSDGMFRHKCVIVRGQAQLSREDHPEVTKKIYTRYLGQEGLKQPFAQKLLKGDTYIVKITPTKILTWDYTKAIP